MAITMVSNVLGTVVPIREIALMAKRYGATVVVDAAQAAGHIPIRIKELGPIDFLVFSAHKMFGPTGVGVLWAREELLEKMPPVQWGGDMIAEVRDDSTTCNQLPWKFEAGTPNIAGVIGLGATIDFINLWNLENLHSVEQNLTESALVSLHALNGIKIFGPLESKDRIGIFSFSMEFVHPHDLVSFLDLEGIAIRVGHLCAQPLLTKNGYTGINRLSLAAYNTSDELVFLFEKMAQAQKYFSKRGV